MAGFLLISPPAPFAWLRKGCIQPDPSKPATAGAVPWVTAPANSFVMTQMFCDARMQKVGLTDYMREPHRRMTHYRRELVVDAAASAHTPRRASLY